MALPELSSEITDTIIDFLHNDLASLAQCGLVCWQWYPASRYHLFSFIVLPQDLDLKNGGRTHSVVLSKNSRVAPYVQAIRMDFDYVPDGWDEDPEAWLPLSQAPPFPALKEFGINADILTWEELPMNVHDWTVRIAENITTFIIDFLEFEEGDALFGLLASMKQLETFVSGRSDIHQPAQDVRLCYSRHIPPPQMTEYSFGLNASGDPEDPEWFRIGIAIAEWIKLYRPKLFIEKLTFDGIDDPDLNLQGDAVKCISNLGVGLTHLTLLSDSTSIDGESIFFRPNVTFAHIVNRCLPPQTC